MNRVAEPGERLSEECGHHCGIQESGIVALIGTARRNAATAWAALCASFSRQSRKPPPDARKVGAAGPGSRATAASRPETEDLIRGLRDKEMAE